MTSARQLTTEELGQGLDNILQSPKDNGVLELIVRRPAVDEREVITEGTLDCEQGLVGDNWLSRGCRHMPDGVADPEMQINIMNARVVALVADDPDRRHLAGDQLYLDMDLSPDNLPPGTQLAVGDAIIEVTGTRGGQPYRFRQEIQFQRRETIDLQVRTAPAMPDNASWLPAAAIELQLNLNADADRIPVGESLGLDLEILARGLPAEDLPTELLSRSTPAYRIYADEARLDNRFDGASIVGRLRQSFVLVASRPGSITLPDILVTWWDTGTHRWRETRLAGRRLQIEATPASAAPAASAAVSPWAPDQAMVWLSGVLVASGLLWYGLQCRNGRQWRKRLTVLRELRALKKALRDACRRGDAAAARASLCAWAARRWPEGRIYGLSAIAGRFTDPAFERELALLDAALYAARPPAWRGQGLWYRFLLRERGPNGTDTDPPSELPRLYPD